MRFLPTNQIWRYWSFERFLVDVSALGLRDVDLWLCNQHVNIDAHAVYNATEVARLLSRYGVRAQTLTPEQSNPKAYNIASSDSVVQRLTKGYYEQVVSLGARLGVQRISLNAGWRLLDDEPARAWGRSAPCCAPSAAWRRTRTSRSVWNPCHEPGIGS